MLEVANGETQEEQRSNDEPRRVTRAERLVKTVRREERSSRRGFLASRKERMRSCHVFLNIRPSSLSMLLGCVSMVRIVVS
jgi:hypothetical protein